MLSSDPTPDALTGPFALAVLVVAVADVALLTAAACEPAWTGAAEGAVTGAGSVGANATRSTPAASAAADSERISAGSAGLFGSCTPSFANAAWTCGRS